MNRLLFTSSKVETHILWILFLKLKSSDNIVFSGRNILFLWLQRERGGERERESWTFSLQLFLHLLASFLFCGWQPDNGLLWCSVLNPERIWELVVMVTGEDQWLWVVKGDGLWQWLLQSFARRSLAHQVVCTCIVLHFHFHLHLHLSLDHKGSLGTTDDFTTSKSETKLTASVLKKDLKHTKGYRECFLMDKQEQICTFSRTCSFSKLCTT